MAVFPNGYPQPVRFIAAPAADLGKCRPGRFPLSIGRELQRIALQLGGPVTL